MHYLVESLERKFPDCLNFVEELSHVDRASRVSLENVQRTLRQMDSSIRNLEQDLNNAKIPQSDQDRFAKVMMVDVCFNEQFFDSNMTFGNVISLAAFR